MDDLSKSLKGLVKVFEEVKNMLATKRPDYLNKTPEQKFWEIQVEEVKDGDYNVAFHYFNCPKKAEKFARQVNYFCFSAKDFFYSTVEKMRRRRGVKHF